MFATATSASTRPCKAWNGRPAMSVPLSSPRPAVPTPAAEVISSIGYQLKPLLRNVAAAAASLEEALVPEKAAATFNLPLAVLLAGCAFEAYNDPAGVTKDCLETSSNGTETTYTDRDYLRKALAGHLKLHLKRATDLDSGDAWGTTDPACCITCGPSTYKSRVHNNTTKPQWDEQCTLFIRKVKGENLQIQVSDDDKFSSDDHLGTAVIPLQKICDGKVHELQLPLTGHKAKGTIELTAEFTPIDKVLWDPVPVSKPTKEIQEEAATTGQWKSLATMAGVSAQENFDAVCFIENKESDTQVWVYRNAAKKAAVLSFRGTELKKLKDVLSDILLSPRAVDRQNVEDLKKKIASRVNEEVGPAAVEKLKAGRLTDEERDGLMETVTQEPWAHGGFLDAYETVRDRCLVALEEIMSQGGGDGWTVYVTGHSLGGALATLCAHQLACHTEWKSTTPRIVMYNYGSPRVGNAALAKEYNAAVPDSWRVTNKKDLVPQVPRSMGFCHVAHGLVIDGDKLSRSTVGEAGTGDAVKVADEALPVLATQLVKTNTLAAIINHIGNFNKVVDDNMKLVSSIVDRSGLEQHEGSFYLKNLSALTAKQVQL